MKGENVQLEVYNCQLAYEHISIVSLPVVLHNTIKIKVN